MKLGNRPARQSLTWVACLRTILAFASTFLATRRTQSSRTTTVIKVFFKPGHPLNRFDSSYALGAAIDGHEKGELDQMLSRENLSKMLSAGFKPISYRLRTELAGEAWHWNPKGSWTEADRGYWVSNDKPGLGELSLSYGYRLPRRGNTFDQANDDGYSRLDDGDSRTFWKSNPYLDEHFTGQANASLPQWIVVDFEEKKSINAIRLNWAEPFATVYDVQFGDFSSLEGVSQSEPDEWHTFPNGEVRTQHSGEVETRLSTEPVTTQFVRVLMKESSETSSSKSSDV